MSLANCKQPRSFKPKNYNHHVLFTHDAVLDRSDHFQNLFQRFKQESQNGMKKVVSNQITPILTSNPQSQTEIKKTTSKDSIQWLSKIKGPQQNRKQIFHQQQMKLGIRSFSSNKFDCMAKKTNIRRNKRMTVNIFKQAHLLQKKQSNSKKSTDDSNSGYIENLKEQNLIIREKIRQQETRLRKLQKAIVEENKRNQVQKYLYRKNIQKLQKIAGVQAESSLHGILQHGQSVLQSDDQQFDSLSIESH